jgi:hypothetical protein
MNIKCLFGFHSWVGCKCSACGRVRAGEHVYNEREEGRAASVGTCAHVWDGLTCIKCGKIDGVWEAAKCTHRWDGCKCRECGTTRDEGHQWDACKCVKCGKVDHSWNRGCRCLNCGQVRDLPDPSAHDWTQDCTKCARCGKTRTPPLWAHTPAKGSSACSRCNAALLEEDKLLILTRPSVLAVLDRLREHTSIWMPARADPLTRRYATPGSYEDIPDAMEWCRSLGECQRDRKSVV